MAATMNRRAAVVWLALGVLAGLVVATAFVADDVMADRHVTGHESVTVIPTEINFEPGARSSGTEVWVYGGGFSPGVEVNILVTDGNGVVSDITGETSVSPLIANEQGAFATKWTLGRFTRSTVGGENVQTLWIVDQNYKNLAAASIAFCDVGRNEDKAEGEELEEVPEWCTQ